MNTKMLLSAVAAAVLGLTMAPVMAQQAEAPSAPAAIKMTPEQKAAARAKRKADAAAAQKAGEVKTGDAAPTMEPKASGTRAERKAAHAAKRKEVAEEQKKGEIAPTGDAPAKK